MPDSRLARLKQGLVFIATHYTGAFIIVLTISIFTCGFTINYLSMLEANLNDVFENEIAGQDYAQSAYGHLLVIESAVKDIIIFQEAENTKTSLAAIQKSMDGLKKAMDDATPRFYTPAGREILAQSKKDMNSYLKYLQSILEPLGHETEVDRTLLARLKERKDTLQADFKHLIANKTANSKNGYQDIIVQLRLSLILNIVIVVAGVGIRIFMYVNTRRQQKALQAATGPVPACGDNDGGDEGGSAPSAPSSPAPGQE
jgi:hypothetical protein